jgi:hypothetical protein
MKIKIAKAYPNGYALLRKIENFSEPLPQKIKPARYAQA